MLWRACQVAPEVTLWMLKWDGAYELKAIVIILCYLTLSNIGVSVKQVFNFLGRDVLPSSHNDVLQPAHNPAIAVRADCELVSGENMIKS